jgi:anti-sigma factor RsiW
MKERCTEIAPLLEEFVDGRLPPKKEVAVRDHVAECPACRVQAEKAREIAQALTDLPPVRCPDRVLRAIEDATRRARPNPSLLEKARSLGPSTLWRTAAVTAAAAVLCALLIGHFAGRNQPPATRYSERETIEARQAARESLRRVVGVMSRTERREVRMLLNDQLPETLRKSIRNATPFHKGGNT